MNFHNHKLVEACENVSTLMKLHAFPSTIEAVQASKLDVKSEIVSRSGVWHQIAVVFKSEKLLKCRKCLVITTIQRLLESNQAHIRLLANEKDVKQESLDLNRTDCRL